MEVTRIEEHRLTYHWLELEGFGVSDDGHRVAVRVGKAEGLVGWVPMVAPYNCFSANRWDAEIQIECELRDEVRVEEVSGELAQHVVEVDLESLVRLASNAGAHFATVVTAYADRVRPVCSKGLAAHSEWIERESEIKPFISARVEGVPIAVGYLAVAPVVTDADPEPPYRGMDAFLAV